MNEDATKRKYEFPPWRVSHCVWLMVCLLAAAVFLGRTLHFEIQDSEWLLFEIATDNFSFPWKLLMKYPLICGPMFGDREPMTVYYLVYWLHTRLFAVNPFFHQLALGAWWAAVFCFLFIWNRRDGRTLAGVIAVLLLLSMNAAWSVLLTKNTLILLCPLVFQLLALYSLRKSVENSSVFSGLLFLLSLTAAAYANWQVLFTFPFVALAYVLFTQHGSRISKTSLMVFMLIVTAALFATSSVFAHLPSYFDKLPSQGELLNSLAYPAQALFSQRVIVGLTLLAVTIALARSGVTGYIALVLSAPAIAAIYFACRYYNIPVWAAYALGMAFYVNLLWLTPWRRSLAVPLAWFLLSFIRWYLFVGSEFLHHDMDERLLLSTCYLESGVALAWLLGVTLSNITAPGFACLLNIRLRFRYACRMLAALLVVIALPIAVMKAFGDFDQTVAKSEAAYHTPYKLAMQKMAADIRATKGIDLTSYHGKAGRLFPKQVQQELYSDAMKDLGNKITLEAYTGHTYFHGPRETYSGINVENATPAAGTERDPFFMPQQWRGVELSTKDGYNPEPLAVVTKQNEPLTTLTPSATVVGHDNFVITGWATSDAWQNVGVLTLTMHQHDREFLWDKIEWQDSHPGSNTKRFVIDAYDATILRTPEHLSQTIELNWGLNPIAGFEGPVEVTIDHATLYIPKP
ncbi:MAG: hypothetical protein P9L94_10260 [Candidatus Hinthialibacter antarcticus]|nr:hypothetical protein [Candidatus Hinthialibacter antarcticus]